MVSPYIENEMKHLYGKAPGAGSEPEVTDAFRILSPEEEEEFFNAPVFPDAEPPWEEILKWGGGVRSTSYNALHVKNRNGVKCALFISAMIVLAIVLYTMAMTGY